MKFKITCLLLYLAALPLFVFAKDDKEDIPPVQDSWNNKNADGNRSQLCSPSLFKDANGWFSPGNFTVGKNEYSKNLVMTYQIKP